MYNRSKELLVIGAAFLFAGAAARLQAQAGRGPQAAPPNAKAGALVDLTGYWVSIVTEDWRFRMVTAPKGDFASVPLNPEGRRVGNMWDPAKDEASGNQCKAYGAPGVMREPGRLHISWENDDTLRLDTDAGTQTRLSHFVASQPSSGEPTWQGNSSAQWEKPDAIARMERPGPQAASTGATPEQSSGRGSLKVVTTHLRPGYLRKNGVPYSGNAVLTEYFTRTQETNGDSWLIVTSIVEDAQYLQQPFITSTHFKRQADASGWNPAPCTAK
jgi:hypothetical protein